MNISRQRIGSELWTWLGCLCLLIPLGARAAVFNFASQLENVLIRSEGPSVFYAVFDPALGRYVTEEETSGRINQLMTKDGIVLWNDGSTYYLRFYDPNRRVWAMTEVASGQGANLVISHGMVAWSSNRLVNVLVYDFNRRSWRLRQDSVVTPVSTLLNSHGLVAWSSGNTISYRAYDPIRGTWAAQDAPTPAVPALLASQEGMVAWGAGVTVGVRTYDPVLGRWVSANIDSGQPRLIRMSGGVVAWSTDTMVYAQAYDPLRGVWRGTSVNSGNTSDLTVHHGTVSVTTLDVRGIARGYNARTGAWVPGLTLPFASFGVSKATGQAPATVYFYDRSLGASGWGWTFGAGRSRFERAGYVDFSSNSLYNTTLTVHGPHGVLSSASLAINLTGAGDGSPVVYGANADVSTGNLDGYTSLEARRTESGLLEVTIEGQPGDVVDIEASADAQTWKTVTTLALSNPTLYYEDPDSAQLERPYYRAKGVTP